MSGEEAFRQIQQRTPDPERAYRFSRLDIAVRLLAAADEFNFHSDGTWGATDKDDARNACRNALQLADILLEEAAK